MVEKIVTVIMGQNCEKYIGMCLDSVKDSDAIVYIDGGSTDNTLDLYAEFVDGTPLNETSWQLRNPYDQEDPQMNGKQRNRYLEFVKEKFYGYWCLCLDADEVVEDFSKIKEFINNSPDGIYSVKMRHLIGDLGHEDAVQPEHFVLNRLFKISEADNYPLVEHPVLTGKPTTQIGATKCTTIWHLAYCSSVWDIKKRYENHLKKSNMHTPEYLKNWYYSHIFGTYPKTNVHPLELPKQVTDEFKIDRDELYFANRGLELKHIKDAVHWRDYFKPGTVIEFGCGTAPRVYAMDLVMSRSIIKGVELSAYAVKNKISEHLDIEQGDILDYKIEYKRELSIAYDVLEHIKYEDLDKAINTLIKSTSKHILVSVPVLGDPNLLNDPTHIIKESKDWWISQFVKKGLKHIETPSHFHYRDQVMIFKKENI